MHRNKGIAVSAGASAAVLLPLAGRLLWARHLARSSRGTPPGVRTDDGVLLHTEIEDRGEPGPTVVLVHGFSCSCAEYDAQREALGQRARLVLFDQRGHGGSGWSGFRSATIERMGRDLAQVIGHAAPEGPVVLVGHSMGGMAVIALAEQCPELFGTKITGVALLSTSAGQLVRAELSPKAAKLAGHVRIARGIAWLLWLAGPAINALGPFHRSWGRRWLQGKLFGSDDPPRRAVKTMQYAWEHTSQAVAAAFYPGLVTYNKSAALGNLRNMPVLVLTGTDDATIPASHSRRLAEQIGSTARLVLVPQAGHMVNMTHPAEVNEALLDLISQSSTSPP
jgi:pimeloyl-ACP methyl ester carboxylesterase